MPVEVLRQIPPAMSSKRSLGSVKKSKRNQLRAELRVVHGIQSIEEKGQPKADIASTYQPSTTETHTNSLYREHDIDEECAKTIVGVTSAEEDALLSDVQQFYDVDKSVSKKKGDVVGEGMEEMKVTSPRVVTSTVSRRHRPKSATSSISVSNAYGGSVSFGRPLSARVSEENSADPVLVAMMSDGRVESGTGYGSSQNVC